MEATLKAGFQALGLPEDKIPALVRYAQMLLETNKVMNLTAITEPTDVANLHFLDCVSLLKLLDFQGKAVADIGTGAGFPGLPLKIVEPGIHLTLVDALGKRVNFLQSVCDELVLSDVACVHARAEEFAGQNRERFDIVTSRAVANLPVLLELGLPLVKVGGTFAAMKSVECDEELNAAQHAIEVLGGAEAEVKDYTIPGTEISHRLVLIRKIKKSSEKYPRMFAKIKKNPL